jgi:hypothetical protein
MVIYRRWALDSDKRRHCTDDLRPSATPATDGRTVLVGRSPRRRNRDRFDRRTEEPTADLIRLRKNVEYVS